MISKSASIAFFVALCASVARADVTPTEPGPGSVFNQGGNCHIAWNGDTSSPTAWKKMSIQLMTGSNFNMVPLTTVASNLDGTVSGVFDFTCPQVTPNAAIYFYQFTSPGSPDTEWTTRFAIASSSGQTTPPSESTQPGTGQAIPWGTGKLANGAAAVPPPSGPSGSSVAKSMTSIPPTTPTSSTSTKQAGATTTTSANANPAATSSSNASPGAASIAPNGASNSLTAGSTATGSGGAGSIAATGTSPTGTADSTPTDTSDSNPTDTSDSSPSDTYTETDTSPTGTSPTGTTTGTSSRSTASASTKANNGASPVGHSIAVVMLAASALVCIVSF